YGHDEAQASLLAAWNGGRFPHALLIGGPEGIGKATLAYRVARFVLANGGTGDKPANLDVDPAHPVSRQVEALAHPDLLVLRGVGNAGSKKLRSVRGVGGGRRAATFAGAPPAYGGYRVGIVPSAAELNRAGANPFLRVL